MKFKLILLGFLLPLIAIGAGILAAFYYPSFSPKVVIDLAYLATILIGIKILKQKFINFKWKIALGELSVALLLAMLLFGSFYIEKVVFQDYQKGRFGIYSAISAVILAPMLEEFFTKTLLLNNLKKVVAHPLLVIGITAIYFWILHLPTLMVTHLLLGVTTATLYYFRKNLLQVIMVHSIYNFMIVAFQYF